MESQATRCAGPPRCRSAACGCSTPPGAGSRRRRPRRRRDRAVPWVGGGRGRTFYAVGGTWRAIARLHMEADELSPARDARLHEPAEEMIGFCEEIRRTRKLLSSMPGMAELAKAAPGGAAGYGALVLERLLEAPLPQRRRVLGVRHPRGPGLRPAVGGRAEEGPAAVLLPRLRAPALPFAEHAGELCRWTDALFHRPGPAERTRSARLRRAACLLSDISWRAHPDYRGEQSLILISQSALGGARPSGPRVPCLQQLFPPSQRVPGGRERRQDKLPRTPQGYRAQAALPAGEDHRCGGARRPHALHRPSRHHRRVAPCLRARQAHAGPAQGPRGAGRRAPPATLFVPRPALSSASPEVASNFEQRIARLGFGARRACRIILHCRILAIWHGTWDGQRGWPRTPTRCWAWRGRARGWRFVAPTASSPRSCTPTSTRRSGLGRGTIQESIAASDMVGDPEKRPSATARDRPRRASAGAAPPPVPAPAPSRTSGRRRPRPDEEFSFGDIFSDLFGSRARPGRAGRAVRRRGRDARYSWRSNFWRPPPAPRSA